MKTNTLTNDDTRDITIRIMDHLIALTPDQRRTGEWYPFDLQDEIHSIINQALEVKE